MRFSKYHGCGNDYIYMDGIHQDVPLDPAWIQKISDRHKGIGSDGLIVVLNSDVADFEMRIFNADGSEGMMCGNGLRCFARFCRDQKLTDKDELVIATKAGLRSVRRLADDLYICNMGKPVIEKRYTLDIDGVSYPMVQVSMGNPHAVTVVEDLALDVDAIGEKLSALSGYPGGINVEFVKRINENEVAARVFERGSRETMACGTGACAIAAALFTDWTQEKTVHLKGGDLKISKAGEELLMKGEAVFVYDGEITG